MVPEPIAASLAQTRGELARVDAKAGILLAISGTALTVGLAVVTRADLPTLAALAGWVTVAVIGAAVALLTLAVRPSLAGNHGFVYYATCEPGDVLADTVKATDLTEGVRAARELVWLSRAALTKFRRVQVAVDLLLSGLAGTAATAVLTAVSTY
ncbi:Pycsar system effector family protein [Polymorphospora sp. NPDC051019]|uniref:Pycsar system effector family protein n=1 Tax=Polymorphospora sp. NPDC051019 TaxID=3155725 RepID=UPI003430A606